MAIIAQAKTLEWFFKAYPQLNAIEEYISQALNPQSEIHKRITTLQIPQTQDRIEVSYPIENGIRAIEQSYYLKSAKNAFFETHKAFLDFQLVISGYEYMCIGDKDTFDIKVPYDESRDLIVYENTLPQNLNTHCQDISTNSTKIKQDSSNNQQRMLESLYTLPKNESLNTPYRTQILLSSGDLAIFFPTDTHAGGLELTPNAAAENSKIVKKSVLKVPVNLIL